MCGASSPATVGKSAVRKASVLVMKLMWGMKTAIAVTRKLIELSKRATSGVNFDKAYIKTPHRMQKP